MEDNFSMSLPDSPTWDLRIIPKGHYSKNNIRGHYSQNGIKFFFFFSRVKHRDRCSEGSLFEGGTRFKNQKLLESDAQQLFQPKLRRGAANSFKWTLFSNYTAIRMLLTVAFPGCCHRMLPY